LKTNEFEKSLKKRNPFLFCPLPFSFSPLPRPVFLFFLSFSRPAKPAQAADLFLSPPRASGPRWPNSLPRRPNRAASFSFSARGRQVGPGRQALLLPSAAGQPPIRDASRYRHLPRAPRLQTPPSSRNEAPPSFPLFNRPLPLLNPLPP
jgi:hypothetical protein